MEGKFQDYRKPLHLDSIAIQKLNLLENEGLESSLTFKKSTTNYKQFVNYAGSVKLDDNSNPEDIFWDGRPKKNNIQYAINNNISLFGDDVIIWNLNKFTNAESKIHGSPTERKVSQCSLFMLIIYFTASSLDCFICIFRKTQIYMKWRVFKNHMFTLVHHGQPVDSTLKTDMRHRLIFYMKERNIGRYIFHLILI